MFADLLECDCVFHLFSVPSIWEKYEYCAVCSGHETDGGGQAKFRRGLSIVESLDGRTRW